MTITFKTQSANYEVIIKVGLLKHLPLPAHSFIITDNNVKKIYGKKFSKYDVISFHSGERYKNFNTIISLARQLISKHADRFGTLAALGGGVVGDVTGFLASIYMRGLPYVQVPTTLLAMADSSLGGKTAIDLSNGKNMLGTFWQPKAVYIDPSILKTLPKSEFSEGMAEIIKHGIINGALFNWIIKNKEKILEQDEKILEQLIYKNCLVKKKIVEEDEKENGKRAILNLGHTFAHAVEVLSDFKISHGKAVAIGLMQMAKISNADYSNDLEKILKYFSLPTSLPKRNKISDIIKAMASDKKSVNKKITLITAAKLGKIKIEKNYPAKKIISCLSQPR